MHKPADVRDICWLFYRDYYHFFLIITIIIIIIMGVLFFLVGFFFFSLLRIKRMRARRISQWLGWVERQDRAIVFQRFALGSGCGVGIGADALHALGRR